MIIRISEVWNSEGKSVELAFVEVSNDRKQAYSQVMDWIHANRPDLFLADSLHSHGFHAIEVSK